MTTYEFASQSGTNLAINLAICAAKSAISAVALLAVCFIIMLLL